MASVVGLLLAGGAGRRFGSQKLVHPIDGLPLVRRAAEGLLASAVDEVVVVTGSEGDRVRAAVAGLPVRLAHAEGWAEGMAATIRAGIEALGDDVGAVLVALADQPAVGAALIDPLVRRWRDGGVSAVAPRFGGAVRPPVLFDRTLFAELLALRGDRGARAVLEAVPDRVAHVDFEMAPPKDVDELSDVEPVKRSEGPKK